MKKIYSDLAMAMLWLIVLALLATAFVSCEKAPEPSYSVVGKAYEVRGIHYPDQGATWKPDDDGLWFREDGIMVVGEWIDGEIVVNNTVSYQETGQELIFFTKLGDKYAKAKISPQSGLNKSFEMWWNDGEEIWYLTEIN